MSVLKKATFVLLSTVQSQYIVMIHKSISFAILGRGRGLIRRGPICRVQLARGPICEGPYLPGPNFFLGPIFRPKISRSQICRSKNYPQPNFRTLFFSGPNLLVPNMPGLNQQGANLPRPNMLGPNMPKNGKFGPKKCGAQFAAKSARGPICRAQYACAKFA